jgi:hypothetical protein
MEIFDLSMLDTWHGMAKRKPGMSLLGRDKSHQTFGQDQVTDLAFDLEYENSL